MKKEVFIFLLFFSLIIGLGAVSASENVSDTYAIEEYSNFEGIPVVEDNIDIGSGNAADANENISYCDDYSNNGLSLNGGTFEDIQAVINNASDGDTIELNGTYVSTGNAITVTKNLTIIGSENAVLDAGKLSGIFNLKAENITLKGLTFVNSNVSAINKEYSENVFGNYSIINCDFVNNSDGENAGALNIILSNNFYIINCSFSNNTAARAGAIYTSTEKLYIKNCRFNNNRAVSVGAVKSETKDFSLEDCLFENNVAEGGTDSYDSVGAIANQQLYESNIGPSIVNCSFINNTVKSSDSKLNIAAVYMPGNCFLSNSKFINNSELNEDGTYCSSAFMTRGESLNVSNCSFINNLAKSKYDGYQGGAISAFSAHISVRDCDFVNNHAMDSGAINCYELDIANCNFIGNSARYCGAVYGWRINATNCNFSDNTAKEWAGALEAGYFNATNCNFVNNRAKYGGAIYVGDSILNNCEFRKNFAESYGSAIVLRLDHELTVSNCIFKDNVANGGENPFGWPFKNYGNSAIACVGKNFKFNAINCVGLVKNDEKFKEKIYLTVEPSSISMVYKTKKYLLIKFKNTLSHNSFKGLQISINLNGKTIVKTADTNGEVKFLINTVPGSYVAKITFAGDNFRQKATKNVKIVVKKLTPKLIASKKSFKVKVKAKQYKATLKDKNGAAIKNTKLTLKVNGKVYAAKTNAKGQATFKITKLTKKGTYKTIISFAGNKYYNKITKTVYLTVKK